MSYLIIKPSVLLVRLTLFGRSSMEAMKEKPREALKETLLRSDFDKVRQHPKYQVRAFDCRGTCCCCYIQHTCCGSWVVLPAGIHKYVQQGRDNNVELGGYPGFHALMN